MLLYGDKRRDVVQKINFLCYTFEVPDLLFIWPFKKIFTDEYYKFNREKSKTYHLWLWCQHETSYLYFKTLYPKAITKAFEADSKIADILKI